MRIEKGKPVHCTETVSGLGLTGNLLISEDELRLELFSYDQFFHIKTENPVHLLAETGECVSLHDCIEGGSGTRGGYQQTITTQHVIANAAVVGPDHWTETDAIKRVTFSVDHTMGLMRSRERIDRIGQEELPQYDHLRLFEDKAKGMTLGAGYGGIWGMDFHTPERLWPVFEIEFDEPQDIHGFVEHVSIYVDFLSFCMGVVLRPSDITIDRLSHMEIIRSIEEKTYQSPHQVHYVWPETEIDTRDLWVGGSPVRAHDEEELSAFRACLVSWMDRADVWRKSYMMMMSSLKRKGGMSAERLVSACKWFEELPNARSENALSREEAELIVAAAVLKVTELGHADLGDRIATSIARIKEETAAERFARLIALVKAKFGESVLPKSAALHLRNAIQFRGRAAHGHFNPESDEEYRSFSKATHAMEALCVLLIAVDLPISDAGISRMPKNPPVRDYRAAYE